MDFLSLKTISAKKSIVVKYWMIIDATNQILGRLSTKIACIIMGKHKPFYSPHINCGDYVIVINSNKIKLSGKKWINKKYVYHTGYPGGQKTISIQNMFNKDSRNIIYKSVKGMLPKNRLGRLIIKNLYVYPESEHKHKAQKPILLK
ncbi:50S ribosomal protein L13 [Blattabacterium cuenoti]|uniref:50S ribosomal protein L13 n=1 Tax=Blattabacterium cuenoti TaxID=1653831 RepID=UPI00163B83F3|nr:50S ribosomal protein L13 [Blattabacterium cuenoti]